MFKRSVIFLVIFSTLLANFNSLFVFAGFEMNQKYIASTLCENRSKPWLHCNGRCYLMKKIKAAENKEKSEDRQTQKSLFQEVFCTAVNQVKFSSSLLQVYPDNYKYSIPEIVLSDLLNPPQHAS